MKFKVFSGKVKDCHLVTKGISKRQFWVTEAGYHVATVRQDGSLKLADGCSIVAEVVPPPAIEPVTIDNLKAEIQTYMDLMGIEFNSGDTKDDLIAKIELANV